MLRLRCPAPSCPGPEDPAARRAREALSRRSNGARGYRRACWLCWSHLGGDGWITGWMAERYKSDGLEAVARELAELGYLGDADLARVLEEVSKNQST